MLQDFSREYVLAARMRCFTNFNLGTPPVSNELIKTLTVTPGSQPTASGAMLTTISSPTAAGTEKRDNLEADLAWSLFFDLISYYRFYEHVIGPPLTELVVSSPVDISFIVLVIICGALGSMLRITAERYHPQLFGNNSSMKERRPPVYYFLIGVMCSLIIYILAKSAFAGITEATYAAKSANLSPFVTAFLAVVSGLLCEEAFNQIITSGKSVLARSGTTQRGSKP